MEILTRSGMLDDNTRVRERDSRLLRAKQCIMRRLEKDDVAKEVARRLNESGCALAGSALETMPSSLRVKNASESLRSRF